MTASITGDRVDDYIYKRIMELCEFGITVEFLFTEDLGETERIVRIALSSKWDLDRLQLTPADITLLKDSNVNNWSQYSWASGYQINNFAGASRSVMTHIEPCRNHCMRMSNCVGTTSTLKLKPHYPLI